MASLVANATAALQTVMGLAEKVPVVGNIVEALQYVIDVADTAEHNKKICAKVSRWCEALALTLASCAREYSANGGPERNQVQGLENLNTGLGRMKTVVDKHSKKGTLGQMFTAKSFKNEFDEVDKEIRDALVLVHLGLSADAVAQNNELLKTIDQLAQIETMVREIREREEGGHVADAAARDVAERLNKLTEMVEHSESIAKHHGIVQGMMLTKQDLMKTASDTQLDLTHKVEGKVDTAIDLLKGAEATLDLVAANQKLQLQKLRKADKDLNEVKATVQETNQTVHQIDDKVDEIVAHAKKMDEGVDKALELVEKQNQLLEKQNQKHDARRRKSAAFKENEIDQSDVTVLAGERLGKGSFGEVFKCKFANQLCAIKYIYTASTMAENQSIYDSFKDEFALMCSVNTCPRVVRVFGIITTMPGKLAMIMEYAAEGSLRDYLTKHASTPLEKNLVRSLVYDIAYGMKALYAKGVHHRDLKAANVLLDEYFHAKVCDFGLSKAPANTPSWPRGGGAQCWHVVRSDSGPLTYSLSARGCLRSIASDITLHNGPVTPSLYHHTSPRPHISRSGPRRVGGP